MSGGSPRPLNRLAVKVLLLLFEQREARVIFRHYPRMGYCNRLQRQKRDQFPLAPAEVAIDVFAEKYGAKHGKAVECLTKDREALLALYDFPAKHWDHLRTTNPIESVFATVRHRTVRTRGSLSPTTAKLMVFKLLNAASKTWRRLKGTNQLPKVIGGVRFQDGIEVIEVPANHAA